jgi:hypothetical protein
MWFFSHKKPQLTICEINFVISSITMYGAYFNIFYIKI